MIDRIKDYFAFSRKEQRGLIALLALMLLIILADLFIPFFFPEKQFDSKPFQLEVEKFLASADSNKIDNHLKKYSYNNDNQDNKDQSLEAFLAAPFYFDPNKLTEEQWKDIGMDMKIIHNIIRYREKGGKFYNSEGFRKIYGMNDSVFKVLEPYLRFDEEKIKQAFHYNDSNRVNFKSQEKASYNSYTSDTVNIELNSADSSSLLLLTGIGPSFAGRIIKYRNKLGGFYCKDQLLEIKGMDSLRLNQFITEITVDPSRINKIELNTVTFKDLMKHPYFEYYLVKAIFSYKDQIKRFDSVEQLKGLPVMYEELFDKISPYLEVK